MVLYLITREDPDTGAIIICHATMNQEKAKEYRPLYDDEYSEAQIEAYVLDYVEPGFTPGLFPFEVILQSPDGVNVCYRKSIDTINPDNLNKVVKHVEYIGSDKKIGESYTIIVEAIDKVNAVCAAKDLLYKFKSNSQNKNNVERSVLYTDSDGNTWPLHGVGDHDDVEKLNPTNVVHDRDETPCCYDSNIGGTQFYSVGFKYIGCEYTKGAVSGCEYAKGVVNITKIFSTPICPDGMLNTIIQHQFNEYSVMVSATSKDDAIVVATKLLADYGYKVKTNKEEQNNG